MAVALTKAAHEAGYADGNGGRVSAYKAMKTPHVQQYLMQAMSESFWNAGCEGARQDLTVIRQCEIRVCVQLEASKDLLDRAGFKPIDRSQVQVAGDIHVTIDLE